MNNNPGKKLIVYLADLDHIRPGNHANIPLGIGSIASYCKNIFGSQVEFFLFKDPNELIGEIRRRPPDILGCSFFMWNANLSLKMIEAAKIINSRTITVIGGSSIARNSDHYKKILEENSSLDIIVIDQGEKAFANILTRVLKESGSESIFSESIAGCSLRLNRTGPIGRGQIIDRGIDLNSFPSPYLKGYYDKFLRAGYVATIETTRGCPHQCTFCCAGVNSYLPIAVKNEETVYEEINYILKHSTTKEIETADTNFGIMGERDLRISRFLLDLYEKTGYPRVVVSASTKQKTKTSIQVMTNMARIMGVSYFALQTLTEQVLTNCRRKNIPSETMQELAEVSKNYHLPVVVDTIFGLPGETLESFMETIDKILLLGVNVPSMYQLKMLPGTIIAEQDRKNYGYKTKFRLLNSRFGEYDLIAGEKPVRIVEVEEIAWQNDYFNAADYSTVRIFGLVSWILVGYSAFSDTIFYLFSRGIKITEVFRIIQNNYLKYPRLLAFFKLYEKYSNQELFDSQQDLHDKITKDDEQWKNLLLNQGIYFKLDLGFSGYCLFEDPAALDDIKEIIFNGIKDKLSGDDLLNFNEVADRDKLFRIIQDKPAGKLNKAEVKKEVIVDENFDYEKWRNNNFKGNLKDYCFDSPVKKIYYFDKFEFFNKKIDEYSDFSSYIFYEKLLMWGPQSLRRLCRVAAD